MNVKKFAAFAGVSLLAFTLSCKNSDVNPDNAAATRADSTIQAYIKSKGLTAKLATSGAYYAITTSNPAGKTPAIGEEIAYKFVGRTLAGKLIDSTLKDSTLYIALGTAGVNLGIQEIFQTMRVGETASIFLYNDQPIVSASRTVLLAAYTPYIGSLTILDSRTEDQQIDAYVASNNLTVTEKTSTGLRFIKTKENPTGTAVTVGQTVTVNYVGTLIRGVTPFDPGPTFTFVTGQNKTVPGFEEGVRKLKTGEKATIIFPSALGYGAQGSMNNGGQYVITPYAPLIFNIELVSAQ